MCEFGLCRGSETCEIKPPLQLFVGAGVSRAGCGDLASVVNSSTLLFVVVGSAFCSVLSPSLPGKDQELGSPFPWGCLCLLLGGREEGTEEGEAFCSLCLHEVELLHASWMSFIFTHTVFHPIVTGFLYIEGVPVLSHLAGG